MACSTDKNLNILLNIIDPITGKIYSNPVVALDNHVYEKESLLMITGNKKNGFSPYVNSNVQMPLYNKNGKNLHRISATNQFLQTNPEYRKHQYNDSLHRDNTIVNSAYFYRTTSKMREELLHDHIRWILMDVIADLIHQDKKILKMQMIEKLLFIERSIKTLKSITHNTQIHEIITHIENILELDIDIVNKSYLRGMEYFISTKLNSAVQNLIYSWNMGKKITSLPKY